MSATQAASCSGVGGSSWRCRSWSRTEPMSIESEVGRLRAEDQLGRPAADVDHQHRRRGSPGGRAWRRRRTAPPPRPRQTSGSTPSRSRTPATKTEALVASRAPTWPKRTRDASWAGSARRTPRSRRTRAPAPGPRSGRSGRGPGRAGPSASRGRDSGAASDEQLDRVGAAVDGGYPHARAALPPGAQQVEHLVAEGVHAPALRERLAGQHVQALDPVGHAAGGDPLDLGDARRARPRAAR